MCNKDTSVTSQPVCTEAEHRMDSTFIIATSEGSEGNEKFQIAFSDDEDSEETQYNSRANSVYDDSGFNSSSEDNVDTSVRQNCDFSDDDSLVGENTEVNTYSSQNLLHKNDKLDVCSELATLGILVQNCENLPLEVNATNEVNSEENSNSVLTTDSVGQNVNSVSNSNITTSNPVRARRQRTDNDNPLVVLDTPVRPRMSRNRRQRSRDMNNNDAAHRSFNSYLSKPLFKLQDCFQDHGLLSLAACIIYTLVLMFAFWIFGGILDSLKSSVGTQNLKDIRQNIVQSRNARRQMASG